MASARNFRGMLTVRGFVMWRTVVASIVVAPCLTACGGNRPGATSTLAPGDVWIQDVTLISAERAMPLPHAHVVDRRALSAAGR